MQHVKLNSGSGNWGPFSFGQLVKTWWGKLCKEGVHIPSPAKMRVNLPVTNSQLCSVTAGLFDWKGGTSVTSLSSGGRDSGCVLVRESKEGVLQMIPAAELSWSNSVETFLVMKRWWSCYKTKPNPNHTVQTPRVWEAVHAAPLQSADPWRTFCSWLVGSETRAALLGLDSVPLLQLPGLRCNLCLWQTRWTRDGAVCLYRTGVIPLTRMTQTTCSLTVFVKEKLKLFLVKI